MPPKQMNLFGGTPQEQALFNTLAPNQSYKNPAVFDYMMDTEQKRLPISGAARHIPGMGSVGTTTGRPIAGLLPSASSKPTRGVYKNPAGPPRPPVGPVQGPPRPPFGPPPPPKTPKESKTLLKKMGVPKGAMGMGMKLLGAGMNIWMIASLLDMAGFMGRKTNQDEALAAAMQSFSPQFGQERKDAHRFAGMQREEEFITDMSNYAQTKQFASEDVGSTLSREFDGLLAGKEGLLATASEMPQRTQQAFGQIAGRL